MVKNDFWGVEMSSEFRVQSYEFVKVRRTKSAVASRLAI
jgi:hypothetical protein